MLGTEHVRQDGHSSLHMLEKPREIDIKFSEFICSHCGTLALKYEVKFSGSFFESQFVRNCIPPVACQVCLLRRSEVEAKKAKDKTLENEKRQIREKNMERAEDIGYTLSKTSHLLLLACGLGNLL